MSYFKFKPLSLVLIFSTFTLVGCQTTAPLQTDPSKAVQARTQMAAEYIKNKQYDVAKRELDTALSINSRDSSANMMMGILLQREGTADNRAKAEKYFKTAVSADPKNPQVRNNYGTYLYQMGRYEDALEQLQIASNALGYDQRFSAIETQGLVYLKLGNQATAEKLFKQALQINEYAYISMIELAELNYLRNDVSSATKYYDNAVKLIGQKNLDARALWVGIRIARANANPLERQVLVNQLRALYPDSPEYQRYLQLQYSTEVVWK